MTNDTDKAKTNGATVSTKPVVLYEEIYTPPKQEDITKLPVAEQVLRGVLDINCLKRITRYHVDTKYNLHTTRKTRTGKIVPVQLVADSLLTPYEIDGLPYDIIERNLRMIRVAPKDTIKICGVRFLTSSARYQIAKGEV